VLSGVCDDRNALFVVTGQHPDQNGTALWAKRDTIADPELQHLRMCPHLIQESKALNNPVVEVDKLRFGELINIDFHDGIHPRLNFAYIPDGVIDAANGVDSLPTESEGSPICLLALNTKKFLRRNCSFRSLL